ncbi:MAG TPA: SPW repeat protein [Bryobacteraceae bacterium]|nr:SPW repeat protein [Bryobacteraceae bacterium]
MSPDEPLTSLDERPNKAALGAVRTASTIVLLAGIWLFVSPWVYGAYHNPDAWNSWIIGAIIIGVAWVRLVWPLSMPGLSWFSMLLGIYVFISPWLYNYTGNTGRFINSLCVGVVVVAAGIASAVNTKRMVTQGPVTRPM